MSKIYTIVQNLNEELYENTKKDNVWYSYTLDNYIDSITFNFFGENNNIKIDLWNSENSQQSYREDTDDYEPLENAIYENEKKIELAKELLKQYIDECAQMTNGIVKSRFTKILNTLK